MRQPGQKAVTGRVASHTLNSSSIRQDHTPCTSLGILMIRPETGRDNEGVWLSELDRQSPQTFTSFRQPHGLDRPPPLPLPTRGREEPHWFPSPLWGGAGWVQPICVMKKAQRQAAQRRGAEANAPHHSKFSHFTSSPVSSTPSPGSVETISPGDLGPMMAKDGKLWARTHAVAMLWVETPYFFASVSARLRRSALAAEPKQVSGPMSAGSRSLQLSGQEIAARLRRPAQMHHVVLAKEAQCFGIVGCDAAVPDRLFHDGERQVVVEERKPFQPVFRRIVIGLLEPRHRPVRAAENADLPGLMQPVQAHRQTRRPAHPDCRGA